MYSNPDEKWLTEYDQYLFSEGTHFRSFDKLGAHRGEVNGVSGIHFAVWAPNARSVSVVGDFNSWDETKHPLESVESTGIWHAFVPGILNGAVYKYSIRSHSNGMHLVKSDPYAFRAELPPKSASVVWDIGNYSWNDEDWMRKRREEHSYSQTVSIYEVHLGSWRRSVERGHGWLNYRELAHQLGTYVREMGFTHVELLPINEFPFDGSWGYQALSYFAPTGRFGTPQDFMYFVDSMHQQGIGVILDWVPAHFPTDGHGLGLFDGTHLYEHADPKQGKHEDWGTYVFNYGRREVTNFIISSALFWFEKYHIDGIRVDAVASMLYNDYSRKEGEWIPNRYGGRENLEAIDLLRRLNEEVHGRFPGSLMIAEESTAWPMVSRPTYVGGLGFGYKWNMGWMNDVLAYISKDPIYRTHHHNSLTFGLIYAFHENFILPFSHDEVVHGKGSMLSKMPGDLWQKFANLRTLYGYMFGHPGKKLLFMGAEFGQWREWDYQHSLDWNLLEYPLHQGLQLWVRDLNSLLKAEKALHEIDFDHNGFRWVDCHDYQQSVLSFVRRSASGTDDVLCVYNFTPVPRHNYRVGVGQPGYWMEILNSDASVYGGSGVGNNGGLFTDNESCHGMPHSLNLTLPPLGTLFLKRIDT